MTQIKCYCGHTTYCDCGPLEESESPKQTSLQWLEERLTLAFPAQANILRVYFQKAREMDKDLIPMKLTPAEWLIDRLEVNNVVPRAGEYWNILKEHALKMEMEFVFEFIRFRDKHFEELTTFEDFTISDKELFELFKERKQNPIKLDSGRLGPPGFGPIDSGYKLKI